MNEVKPVDLLLFCPRCGTQHVDEARPNICETCGNVESECSCVTFTAWLNPPHKSHRCEVCNHVWRPADVPTNGVRSLQSKGKLDGDPRPTYSAGFEREDCAQLAEQMIGATRREIAAAIRARSKKS